MIDQHHRWNVSFKPLMIGFTLSLLLTLATYRFVIKHHLSGMGLVWAVFGMAVLQALLQLVFFLHLGLEAKPHWNTLSFLFTVLVILIVIGGSLWIMYNLYYNEMPT